MSRLAGERGWVLTDVLLSMSLTILLFGATLTAFNGFENRARANQLQNEAQSRARAAMDELARSLRNHWIEEAEPTDVVAQAVNGTLPASGNVRRRERVRYCLQSVGGDRTLLWRQVQNWTEPPTPAMAPTGDCPADGWTASRVVATGLTNAGATELRPTFLYDASDPARISELRTQLFVDVEPARAPGETRLTSGVFLRNQNVAPSVASFTVTSASNASGGQTVYLNGSFSDDPDGDKLTYVWKDNGTPIEDRLGRKGALIEYPTGSGTHRFTLTVRDPAGLERVSEETVVTLP